MSKNVPIDSRNNAFAILGFTRVGAARAPVTGQCSHGSLPLKALLNNCVRVVYLNFKGLVNLFWKSRRLPVWDVDQRENVEAKEKRLALNPPTSAGGRSMRAKRRLRRITEIPLEGRNPTAKATDVRLHGNRQKAGPRFSLPQSPSPARGGSLRPTSGLQSSVVKLLLGNGGIGVLLCLRNYVAVRATTRIRPPKLAALKHRCCLFLGRGLGADRRDFVKHRFYLVRRFERFHLTLYKPRYELA